MITWVIVRRDKDITGEKNVMTTEAEKEREFRRCYSNSFRDKGRDHKPKKAGRL